MRSCCAACSAELRQDVNLDVFGFSEEELNALLAEAPDLPEGLTDEDAVPEPPGDQERHRRLGGEGGQPAGDGASD